MIDQLVEKINSLPRKRKTLLIGIAGRGGSGKSTLAEKLREMLSDAIVIHLDDFYSPELNEGYLDLERLREQVIDPLKEDNPANYQKYDWGTKKLVEWRKVEPGGIVIIEGVSLIHDDMEGAFDFTVWIECPAEVGFQRGLERDKSVYGVDTTEDWLNVWLPEEKKYVETQRPQEKADFVVDFNNL